MDLKITDEKVRAIASKHPAMMDTLKEVFPEAFTSEYVEFHDRPLSVESIFSSPFVGTGLAPFGMEGKCIMWDSRKLGIEHGEYNGTPYIAFKKLKP